MWPTADDWLAVTRGERRGPAAAAARAALWWARLPYAAGVWVRNRRYDAGRGVVRVPVPVVCVGNLSVGGTGKTPCVEWVAGHFRNAGKQVAILSRGYGTAAGRNDEAMVLEENLPDVPHLQGRDRVALAMTAIEELESDILVLDDGFQHRRLGRDFDIVLIDATRPADRDYLLPRGTLREPVGELRRAGVVILTRCDQVEPAEVDRLRARFAGRTVATAVHAPVGLVGAGGREAGVGELRGKPVGAFCGIGNPAAFRRTLADLGAEVVAFRAYADHRPYDRADVDALRGWAEDLPADAIVATTQKDFVKLRTPELAGRPLWAVRVGITFLEGEEAVRERLDGVIAK